MENNNHCLIYFLIPYLLLSCQVKHTETADDEKHQFILGGTIENLSDHDITIVNNKGSELHLSEDGSFLFSDPYTNNETFSVSILTPPKTPELVCEISNGRGIFDSENIFNVNIICEKATQEYSVGANIQGLEGENLILTLNTDTSISADSNGFLSFPGTFATGIEYTVTVTQQPDTPKQHCEVAYGSGTIYFEDINNIAITCENIAPIEETFSISVLVEGLYGTNLSLKLNDSIESLVINENGRHYFPSKLREGDAFEVFIVTPPSSPNQHCKLNSANGRVPVTGLEVPTISCIEQQIKLQWDAPIEDDVAGYNIYHAMPGAELSKLTFVTAETLSYVHQPKKKGQHFYSISSIDFSGNESPSSDVIEIALQ